MSALETQGRYAASSEPFSEWCELNGINLSASQYIDNSRIQEAKAWNTMLENTRLGVLTTNDTTHDDQNKEACELRLFDEMIRHEVGIDPTNPVITGERVDKLLYLAFKALEIGQNKAYHEFMHQAKIYGKFLDSNDPRNPDYTPGQA